MSTLRQIQHRIKRDGRRSRELADLKRSQHQLEAETRRLQETLSRTKRPRVVKVVEKAVEPAPRRLPRTKNSCPQCGERMKLVDLGRLKMWVCPSCKWHAKKE